MKRLEEHRYFIMEITTIAVLMLHPGWVKTDMGGENAPTSLQESITGMRRVIDEFTWEKSGNVLDFSGQELPW